MDNALRLHGARRRTGAILVMTTLFLVFFAALAALGVDLGWVYVREARLQRSVNASVVAAANALQAGSAAAQVKTSAKNFAHANGYDVADTDIYSNPNGNNSGLVRVAVNGTVPLLFANLLGFKTLPVSYSAWAQAADNDTLVYQNPTDPKMPSGMVPLYVAHANMGPVALGTASTPSQLAALIFGSGTTFTVGQRYLIKTGSNVGPQLKSITGLSTSAHQGVLDLPPPGGAAMDFTKTLEYGYAGGVEVGDTLSSVDGAYVAESKAGSDFRYNQDSASSESSAQALSARMVIVPIVAAVYSGAADRGTGVANYAALPYGYAGAVDVQVIGLARFFMDGSSTAASYGSGAITGIFSGYVGTPPDGQKKG